MSEYERRALREHAEHHYKERHSEDAKIILGAIILAPMAYFLLVVLMSF